MVSSVSAAPGTAEDASESLLPSAEMRYEKKKVSVKGKMMAYIEVGSGDPIVFVHGNPTSSFMWRNVLPHCEGLGRLIAPDLIGMGDSEKLKDSGPDSYQVPEQYAFFEALMEELGVKENVTLVCHSWGGVIGSRWLFIRPRGGPGRQANFGGLVLGCIEAKFCK